MDAVVEVATARVATNAKEAMVFVTVPTFIVKAMPVVAASTQRTVSISGHSISAVAPDHILKEELAKAGV